MEQENKWMVYVSCMTFNHAPYIVDALNGFTMQETTFPYVCAVIDDASTDGEQEVIKNYLQEHFDLEDTSIVRNEETDDYVLTFARHKSNKNCYFAVLYLKYNHYSIKKSKIPYIQEWRDNSKYIALCEGDDYWIAPNKLQMQVEFLEGNEDYGLVYTMAKRKHGDKFLHTFGYRIKDVESLYIRNVIPTLTTCFRCFLYQNYLSEIKPYEKGWKMGDYPLWLYIQSKSKIFFFNKITSVYRISLESASHSASINKRIAYQDSSLEIRNFFIVYFHLKDSELLKRKIQSEHDWAKCKMIAVKEGRMPNAYCKDNNFSHKIIVFLFNNLKRIRTYLIERWR